MPGTDTLTKTVAEFFALCWSDPTEANSVILQAMGWSRDAHQPHTWYAPDGEGAYEPAFDESIPWPKSHDFIGSLEAAWNLAWDHLAVHHPDVAFTSVRVGLAPSKENPDGGSGSAFAEGTDAKTAARCICAAYLQAKGVLVA